MSKCITHQESEAYVKKMVSSGIPILNPPIFIQAYVRRSSLSKRQLHFLAETIVLGLEELMRKDVFPVFYMLNLVVTEDGNKHSMMLCLDKNKKDEYSLELFDSNGTLDPSRGWDSFVYPLVLDAKNILEQELGKNVKFVEVRKSKESINNFGSGNCDALSLYYAVLRSKYTLAQVNSKLDKPKMDNKRTTQINKTIQKKQLFK